MTRGSDVQFFPFSHSQSLMQRKGKNFWLKNRKRHGRTRQRKRLAESLFCWGVCYVNKRIRADSNKEEGGERQVDEQKERKHFSKERNEGFGSNKFFLNKKTKKKSRKRVSIIFYF